MEFRKLWRGGNSVVVAIPPAVLRHIGGDIGDWITFSLELGPKVVIQKALPPSEQLESESEHTVIL
jgi:antitoxin component of MazEF toxin-antitoxin module